MLPDPGERTLFKLCLSVSQSFFFIFITEPGIRWHQENNDVAGLARCWGSMCFSSAGPAHCPPAPSSPLHCALCPLAMLNYCSLTLPAPGFHCHCSLSCIFFLECSAAPLYCPLIKGSLLLLRGLFLALPDKLLSKLLCFLALPGLAPWL